MRRMAMKSNDHKAKESTEVEAVREDEREVAEKKRERRRGKKD